MTQKNRLQAGGRINRSKPMNFVYNGKTYQGFEGDTLASAMLANGIDIVGRSFKYSRPRGIVAAGAEPKQLRYPTCARLSKSCSTVWYPVLQTVGQALITILWALLVKSVAS